MAQASNILPYDAENLGKNTHRGAVFQNVVIYFVGSNNENMVPALPLWHIWMATVGWVHRGRAVMSLSRIKGDEEKLKTISGILRHVALRAKTLLMGLICQWNTMVRFISGTSLFSLFLYFVVPYFRIS